MEDSDHVKILDNWSTDLLANGAPHQQPIAQAAQALIKQVRGDESTVATVMNRTVPESRFDQVVTERDDLRKQLEHTTGNLEEALNERDKAHKEVEKLQAQILKLDTTAKAAEVKADVDKLQGKVEKAQEKAQEAEAQEKIQPAARKAHGDSSR